jgi:sec-independent protein translocase protein TatC
LTLLTWLSTLFICYLYKEILLLLIIQSSVNAFSNQTSFYFIFTNVSEVFYSHLSLIFFVSFQVLFLYFIYHSFAFLTPALFYKEYYNTIFLLKVVVFVWGFSVVMTHFALVPLSWKFFLSFQSATKVYFSSLYFEAKLNEYLNFYISLCYLSIVYCQLFVIFFLLLSYTNTSLIAIKKFRKLNYYIFVIFSTLISPPDILSQVLLSTFTIILYEFLIFVFIFKYLTRYH